jgi:hypothetical protein
LTLQKENKVKTRECDAFRRAAESLKEDNRKLKIEIMERDRLIQVNRLVLLLGLALILIRVVTLFFFFSVFTGGWFSDGLQ